MKNFTHLTRREFLRLAAIASGSALLSACQQALPTPTATLAPTLLPSSMPLPTVTATRTPTATATPKPLTLRDVGEKLGIYFGTTVDGSERWRDANYIRASTEHFSVVMPSGSFSQTGAIDVHGLDEAREFKRRATLSKQILHIHAAFWHQDVRAELKVASNEMVVKYMDDRIRTLLSFTEKIDTGVKPTYITFFNEPFFADYKSGRFGYSPSPYQRVFGNRLISETYLMFDRLAKEMGLEIGKDFRMIYNDYDINIPGGKTDFVIIELSRAKNEVAERLGKKAEDVQLDVGIQCHLFLSGNSPFLRGVPTKEDLMRVVEGFKQIGRVHLTEVNVLGTKDQTEINNRLLMVNQVAVEKGCLSTNYWRGLALTVPKGQENNIFINPKNLFDDSFNPTQNYQVLLKDLMRLTEQGQSNTSPSQPNATVTPKSP